MTATACEYYPLLPSPFNAGALGAALLVGLTFSAQTIYQSPAQQIQVSGSTHVISIAENKASVVPRQDIDDIEVFANFSLHLSRLNHDVPAYFLDVLQEDFESLLA